MIHEAVTDTNDSSYLVPLDQIYDIVGEEDWIHGESNCLVNLASSRTITLRLGAKKKECKEQRRVLSDEGLQVGNHVVVENHVNRWAQQAQIIDIDINEGLQVGDDVIVDNHGKYWPHKAQKIGIDMETNIALIRWQTTQQVDLVHLKDLKQFSLNNATPRKQKYHRFLMTDLICKAAQKICFIQRRTLLSCALKVPLGT